VITIRQLDKIHDPGGRQEFQALHGINLKVAAGELLVLEGVSGSGKTTLLSILAALARPTRGDVLVDGQAIAKLPDLHASAFRASTVGLVPQAIHFFEELSVRDNVALPVLNRRLKQGQVDAMVARALKKANLEGRDDQKARTLSGGERQRCALARALVTSPRVLLCDEPTANLDRKNSLTFMELLAGFKSQGQTQVLATHDPLIVEHQAVDRVVRLADGRIAAP
jgi:putative ABC transport system ATP-binding protein